MSNDLVEDLLAGVKENISEKLDTLAKEYMPKINKFYQSVEAITKTQLFKSGAITEKSTVFDKMKDAQLPTNISTSLQEVRNQLIQQKDQQEKLTQLNQLLGEGYAILTRIGEEIRNREIQYMITYESSDSSAQLIQRVVKLKDFISTFELSDNGKIFFNSSLETKGVVTNSFINPVQWQKLLKFQEIARSLRLGELTEAQLTDVIVQYKLSKGKNKELIRQIFVDKNIRKHIYIDSASMQDPHEIVQHLFSIVAHSYNKGRLIEFAAKLKNANLQLSLTAEDVQQMIYAKDKAPSDQIYYEDNIAFYKQGDFILDNIEYQSKMRNASVNLNTIINGMKQITQIFTKYNDKSIKTQTLNEDGKDAWQQAKQHIINDLMDMFTAN